MRTIISEKRLRAILEKKLLKEATSDGAFVYKSDSISRDFAGIVSSLYSGGTDFGQHFENIFAKYLLDVKGISSQDLNPSGNSSLDDESKTTTNAELADIIFGIDYSPKSINSIEELQSATLLSVKSNKSAKSFLGKTAIGKIKKLANNFLLSNDFKQSKQQMLKFKIGTANMALNPIQSKRRSKVIYDLKYTYPIVPNVGLVKLSDEEVRLIGKAQQDFEEKIFRTVILPSVFQLATTKGDLGISKFIEIFNGDYVQWKKTQSLAFGTNINLLLENMTNTIKINGAGLKDLKTGSLSAPASSQLTTNQKNRLIEIMYRSDENEKTSDILLKIVNEKCDKLTENLYKITSRDIKNMARYIPEIEDKVDKYYAVIETLLKKAFNGTIPGNVSDFIPARSTSAAKIVGNINAKIIELAFQSNNPFGIKPLVKVDGHPFGIRGGANSLPVSDKLTASGKPDPRYQSGFITAYDQAKGASPKKYPIIRSNADVIGKLRLDSSVTEQLKAALEAVKEELGEDEINIPTSRPNLNDIKNKLNKEINENLARSAFIEDYVIIKNPPTGPIIAFNDDATLKENFKALAKEKIFANYDFNFFATNPNKPWVMSRRFLNPFYELARDNPNEKAVEILRSSSTAYVDVPRILVRGYNKKEENIKTVETTAQELINDGILVLLDSNGGILTTIPDDETVEGYYGFFNKYIQHSSGAIEEYALIDMPVGINIEELKDDIIEKLDKLRSEDRNQNMPSNEEILNNGYLTKRLAANTYVSKALSGLLLTQDPVPSKRPLEKFIDAANARPSPETFDADQLAAINQELLINIDDIKNRLNIIPGSETLANLLKQAGTEVELTGDVSGATAAALQSFLDRRPLSESFSVPEEAKNINILKDIIDVINKMSDDELRDFVNIDQENSETISENILYNNILKDIMGAAIKKRKSVKRK